MSGKNQEEMVRKEMENQHRDDKKTAHAEFKTELDEIQLKYDSEINSHTESIKNDIELEKTRKERVLTKDIEELNEEYQKELDKIKKGYKSKLEEEREKL
jgi:hypothetical protein